MRSAFAIAAATADAQQSSDHTLLAHVRITGGTVMDRIIAIDHFSEKDAAAVTADVLNAIHYLHNIGITHRDLKVRDKPSISFRADVPMKLNLFSFLV